MEEKERKYISKKMSYALRHNPQKYGLQLADDGSADMKGFLRAMNNMHHFEPRLTEERIRDVMAHSDKQRFAIEKGRIRALYGHSFQIKIQKKAVQPPDVLYHGTAHRFLGSILEKGLMPMSRQYVHLCYLYDLSYMPAISSFVVSAGSAAKSLAMDSFAFTAIFMASSFLSP